MDICKECKFFKNDYNEIISNILREKDIGQCRALPPVYLLRENRKKWLNPEVSASRIACSLFQLKKECQ